MAHHKRRRPKSRRAGCLLCSPHKDQRVKDCFDSKTVQERRELQDEVLPRTHKSRRKNTRIWCCGKKGVPHSLAWVDLGRWWHYKSAPPRWHSEWTLRCEKCGKQLGWVYPWSKHKIVIHKFPGWEAFSDGPPETSLKSR